MDNRKKTVLIVDDSHLQRVVFSKMLEENFNTIEAEDGKECLEIIRTRGAEIDAVLIDMVMPEMDGIEVLEERQKMEEFRKIPVVVLSSEQSTDLHEKALELGAYDFLMKPAKPDLVNAKIQRAIGQGVS